jgi:CRISPR system Cascade subunit CasC
MDSALQVAHAISSHEVYQESDFFTAMDNMLDDKIDPGAGMMGDVDFNSCCYYEYAALDTDQLRENLKYTDNCEELVDRLVPALLRTMIVTNPSGKQNTFAGQVLPAIILVECKQDKIPLSYVNTFEDPVTSYGGRGIVTKSVEKLSAHVMAMDDAYQLPVEHRAWMSPLQDLNVSMQGERVASMPALLECVAAWVKEDQP